MITVINLNVSVDKRYELPELTKGQVIRARSVDNTAGGKGIHVANIANILGEDVLVTGFLGGKTGEFIEEKLQEMNIKNHFLKIKGATRECLALITDDFIQTEILEPGPEVTTEELQQFLQIYDKLLTDSSVVVASGSIPKNVQQDIYAFLIKKASNKKFLLDTSGELLLKGIEAKPFLIKPNKEELEALVGRYFETESDILAQVQKLNSQGIECVIVSLGSKGFIAGCHGKNYRVTIPKVQALNSVGSGDSLVGGFAVGLARNYAIRDILALAAACGTANALEKETGFVRKAEVERLLKEVTVSDIT